MERAKVLQEIRNMRFEKLYERQQTGRMCRYEDDGLEGLLDQRLGRMSVRRAPVDQVLKVEALYRERYAGFNAKHFHEKLLQAHQLYRSYTCTKRELQQAGVMVKAKRRGAHHQRRSRHALVGMMLHQDGSRHEWVPGVQWDLIVTMDDADNRIYSAFFVAEEGR